MEGNLTRAIECTPSQAVTLAETDSKKILRDAAASTGVGKST